MLVHREFIRSHRETGPIAPVFVEKWKDFEKAGAVIGNPRAPVRIVEFLDFECPFCNQFHRRAKLLREEFRDSVAEVYVHFPLANHRFSMQAARAAECAAKQGRFESMVDQIFAKQDSLGLRPWHAFAIDAGVDAVDQFDRCAAETGKLEAVEAGITAGQKLEVHGTPTLLINGWRFNGAPPDSQLLSLVRSLLDDHHRGNRRLKS